MTIVRHIINFTLSVISLSVSPVNALAVPILAKDGAQTLFSAISKKDRSPRSGTRTFIFWVNGDSDHFQSGLAYAEAHGGEIFRVDKYDVERIRGYAQNCGACNVVILHHQRGGSRWYTANEPWATYLRVYESGKMIAERHIPIGNAADPIYLAQLLRFSEGLFPNQPSYLIYRGHSFFPNYDPRFNRDRVMPFAYGFADFPYGIATFEKSLRSATLQRPLEGVVFAACGMARIEAALALAPYAKRLIASQVDILETLSSGFLFSFLLHSSRIPDEDTFSRSIASSLMGNIELVSFINDGFDESMMEYPMTLMDLRGLDDLKPEWLALLSTLSNMNLEPLLAQAHIERVISNRYAENLRDSGLSDEKIELRAKFVRTPAPDPNVLDAIQTLKLLNGQVEATQRLSDDLNRRLRVFNSSRFSQKLGISLSAK